ncbi:MBL fold metallo-hydrolase [Wenxinia marina]|uniref:Putative Zn-dependent hydrolase of the beta-lactamase fold protein n=1 Tax=Wenxinia marina DSM 24838 TaxID=1123501 RepID=A0A0D0Q008_9RHOB|nr:MBL fold metallo-hydrolase [Wenxinia marina]KIQ67949.1 putative Zn-dependent hydrolase of the beta-lactamase fold protein [Wenxinia marina DSM 24838]GGL75989.1 Zn-dependent hydrolase [Wenxinia marina]
MRLLPLLLAVLPLPLAAQERIPSHCLAFAEAPAQVVPAAWADPLEADTFRLHYIDHSMFLLRLPSGLNLVTDFNGFVGPTRMIPDVVTMNRAHSTHWTRAPDPAIPHVLPGWGEGGGPADHHLDLGEVLVRNVPTDIRDGFGGAVPDGNSVFVFEAAGLCIGHLGHLHHEPTDEDYARIGRVDVALVAVDGGMTLDIPTVLATMERMRASLVIPMHWFGRGTLEAFAAGMEEAGYRVERPGGPEVVLSRDALPDRPTVMILEPSWLE